jgi:hypothetical protein
VSDESKAKEERLSGKGEISSMPNQGTQNQPSHETQIKGGEQSHQGNTSGTGSNRTPPSKDEAAKGGQNSHSGGNR